MRTFTAGLAFFTLVIVAVVAVGCGRGSTVGGGGPTPANLFDYKATVTAEAAATATAQAPKPTLDVPRFVDGEAIAVVKTWLSGMTYEIERKRDVGDCGIFSARRLRRRSEKSTPECQSVVVVRQHNCLDYYLGFVWSSAYLGNGVWSVTAQGEERQRVWRVFEGTSSVDTMGEAGRCG